MSLRPALVPVGLSFLVGLAACSSGSTKAPTGTAAADPNLQGTETNPYGKPYPTDSIGFRARNDVKSCVPRSTWA